MSEGRKKFEIRIGYEQVEGGELYRRTAKMGEWLGERGVGFNNRLGSDLDKDVLEFVEYKFNQTEEIEKVDIRFRSPYGARTMTFRENEWGGVVMSSEMFNAQAQTATLIENIPVGSVEFGFVERMGEFVNVMIVNEESGLYRYWVNSEYAIWERVPELG